jgi:cobalt-zinc-cadmium efflux system protein
VTDHGHDHAPREFGRAFAIGISLNVAFVAVEVVYGLLAHSMALLGDAFHNLSDVLGLLVAYAAVALSRRAPSKRHTYGFRRASILTALFNSVTLVLVTGAVAWEAIGRIFHPVTVEGRSVVVVATAGVVVNGVAAWLFRSGRNEDVNIHAAFLHLASDAAISFGVALTGVVILSTGWMWLDPAVSLLLSAAILATTWSLLRRSMRLALDAVPEHVDVDAVSAYLASLPGVREVHDLHVWPMSTTETILTAHLVLSAVPEASFLAMACADLEKRFRIGHATLQLEAGATPCVLAPHTKVDSN